MKILPIKISKYFDNRTALKILNEDILIVAPIVTVVPFHEKSRESLQVDENDFDESYSNETGLIYSATPTIVSSIIVCSNSYREINSAHCMPLFSQRSNDSINISNPMTGKTADSDIDGIAMECENIAYLLTLMGKEIYLPLHLKGGHDLNTEIKKSRLSDDILPGYVCYKYNPGDNVQHIAVVKQEILFVESNKKFISPINANEYTELSVTPDKKTDFSIAKNIMNKIISNHDKINEMHKAGLISTKSEEMFEEIRKEIKYNLPFKEFCPYCKRKISNRKCFDCRFG